MQIMASTIQKYQTFYIETFSYEQDREQEKTSGKNILTQQDILN